MITVKLFGLLRLETGIKELCMEAKSVRELLRKLETASDGKLHEDAYRGCVVIINGKAGKKNTKLNDGDVVTLLPPVAGG